MVKQKGVDPLEPESGIPWAEFVAGEIPTPLIMAYARRAIEQEGGGVRVVPQISPAGNVSFKIELTDVRRVG